MGPRDIVSVDHATMEAIWTAEGSETRAPLTEGPDGFAIASFGKRTYRSEVPNLMLDVPPPTMASIPSAGAPIRAPPRAVQRVLKRPAAFKRPAAARPKAAPVPRTAGSTQDCAAFFCSPASSQDTTPGAKDEASM